MENTSAQQTCNAVSGGFVSHRCCVDMEVLPGMCLTMPHGNYTPLENASHLRREEVNCHAKCR